MKQSSTLCKDAVFSNPTYQTTRILLQVQTCLQYPQHCPLWTASGFSDTPPSPSSPSVCSRLFLLVSDTWNSPLGHISCTLTPQSRHWLGSVAAPLLPISHYPHSYLRVKAASQGADIHMQVFEQSCCPMVTLKVLKKEMTNTEFWPLQSHRPHRRNWGGPNQRNKAADL